MSANRLPTLVLATLFILLAGCDAKPPNHQTDAQENASQRSIETTQRTDTQNSIDKTESQTQLSQTAPPSTRNTAIDIDWNSIATGVSPTSKDNFDYPFAIDSKPVQSYVDYFNVTPQQAQYNLTVNMASNEVVVKVLDQLGDSYVSHSISDDMNAKLVIETTPNVTPSSYDYVIADAFARGLVLPIEIKTVASEPSS